MHQNTSHYSSSSSSFEFSAPPLARKFFEGPSASAFLFLKAETASPDPCCSLLIPMKELIGAPDFFSPNRILGSAGIVEVVFTPLLTELNLILGNWRLTGPAAALFKTFNNH